jgi:hypothetical protein
MPEDPGAIWRDQPEEETSVNVSLLVHRRAAQLSSSTRAEILTSIAAALLFVAVMGWRLGPPRDSLLVFAYAAIVAWAAISAVRFRRQIRGGEERGAEALAATCLDYYRRELERRRDHLRSAWVWQGPLVLACLTLAAVLMSRRFLGFDQARNAAPLVALLAAWTALGVWRRRRLAKELQREIDELES